MATESIVSSVMSSMGKGSGIDILKLARDLTDVEKVPAEERINEEKAATEAKISALAVLKYNVQTLIDQLNGLNDASELATPTATSADTTKVSVVSTDGTAKNGISDISVTTLAKSQRNKSNQYSSKTQALNGGSSFTLTLTPGTGTAKTVTVAAGNDTPQGVVSAINSSGMGITATLLAEDSSGSNYRIMLSGTTGATNSFVVSSNLTDSDLGFHDTSNGNSVDNSGTKSMQNPGDASLTYNGQAITRSSNTLNDVISGVTISLNATHSGGATTSINVVSDRSTLKTKLEDLVTTYNSVQYALDEISDSESEDEDVGGALAKDLQVIRTVRDTVYSAITQNSTTTSGSITGLRDIGVTLTSTGNLSMNEATYDSVAATSFDDISVMLSAGTTNQSRYDGQSQGFAIDAVKKLENLTDSISGIFATRTQSAQNALSDYSKELADLETRMDSLYERYISQFTIMENLVNQLNSTRESLSDTWANMGKFD